MMQQPTGEHSKHTGHDKSGYRGASLLWRARPVRSTISRNAMLQRDMVLSAASVDSSSFNKNRHIGHAAFLTAGSPPAGKAFASYAGENP